MNSNGHNKKGETSYIAVLMHTVVSSEPTCTTATDQKFSTTRPIINERLRSGACSANVRTPQRSCRLVLRRNGCADNASAPCAPGCQRQRSTLVYLWPRRKDCIASRAKGLRRSSNLRYAVRAESASSSNSTGMETFDDGQRRLESVAPQRTIGRLRSVASGARKGRMAAGVPGTGNAFAQRCAGDRRIDRHNGNATLQDESSER